MKFTPQFEKGTLRDLKKPDKPQSGEKEDFLTK